MGLDQYLNARKMFSDARNGGEYASVLDSVGAQPRPKSSDWEVRLATVEVEVAYWRKSNAIHRWFVEQCQGGEDDCREYPVRREQLGQLIELCQMVKDDPSKAEEYLPTMEGFFFGTYEFDDWYFDALDRTVEQLTEALDLEEEWSFYYQSSW